MNRLRALFRTGITPIVALVLILLAGCNTTGIPDGGLPEAASTTTPGIVAVAPTPTLPEFMPDDTATPGAGGGARPNTPTTRPRATRTAENIEPTEEPTAVVGEPTPTILPLAERLDLFEQVWDNVDRHYLYADFNGVDWAAIHDKYEPLVRDARTSTEFYTTLGDMVAELDDEHSRFLSPQEAREEDDLQSGNASYVGIGIISSPAEDSVLVVFVFPDSPADKAGLKRRDQIVAIDGKPIDDPTDISGRIRGPAGTTVHLTVRSPGQAERDVPIVRGRITGAVVPASSRLENEPSIGYLIIPNLWTEDMGDRVEVELDSLLNGSPKLAGLVVDLRGNGGGFRTVLEQILSFFVSGQVGSFYDQHNSYPFSITASPMMQRLKNVPVVVLVDNGTESYAEVLAASIQEKGRAQVVGVVGAGNTETIYQYNFDDGSRLWCAQEGFKLLDGTNMEGRGVIPDFKLEDDWTAFSEREDPHILKAIELLTQQ